MKKVDILAGNAKSLHITYTILYYGRTRFFGVRPNTYARCREKMIKLKCECGWSAEAPADYQPWDMPILCTRCGQETEEVEG